jgi:glycosyltransferase involved in cell wall biosynthesis
LIEAFARISNVVPGAELSIYGYGDLEAGLASQIAALGLEGRVRLEGRTQDSAKTLQDLDVFVFSSLNEGLPLVILEAMAAGLPIVTSDVGGVGEVLAKEAAWSCPPNDAVALAEAMLQAIHAGDLRERGEVARRRTASAYGIEHMAAHYETLYCRLSPKSA